jgi:hypothetical protein
MNLAMSIVMAGANFWDAATHVMSGSNDLPTRKKIFEWIERHEQTLYHPRLPVNPIGVYYSPATRNYFVDEFMRSYQGIVIRLLQAHREFQIVTPRTLSAFRGSTLILPDVRVISETERAALGAQVSRGTRLIATGTDATGLAKPSPDADAMNALPDQDVRVDASPAVATDIARVDGKVHVFFANFDGLVGGQNAVQTPQKGVRVSVPADGSGKGWFLPFLGEAAPLAGQPQNGRLVFTLPDIPKGAIFWLDE